MYALFQKIKKHGIEYAKQHCNELTPFECAELLLHDINTASFIPFERMTAESWYYFMLDDHSNCESIYKKIPWEEIPSWYRDDILMRHQELVVPECNNLVDSKYALSGTLFSTSLFLRARDCRPMVRFVDFETKESFDKFIDIFPILKMFNHKDYVATFLTCSCGIPGDAYLKVRQYAHLTPSLIHWSVGLNKKKFELYFDRKDFEDKFASILSRLLKNGPQEWDGHENDHGCHGKDYAFYLPNYHHLYRQTKRLIKTLPHLEPNLSDALETAKKLLSSKSRSDYSYPLSKKN